MIRPFITAAAAFGLVLAAQGATAAAITVRHADLDLSTAQGQQELGKRIEIAARKACTVPAKVGSIVNRVNKECYEAAVQSVRQNVALAQRTTSPSH